MKREIVNPIQSTEELLRAVHEFGNHYGGLAKINSATGLWLILHFLTETIHDGGTLRAALSKRYEAQIVEMLEQLERVGGDPFISGRYIADAVLNRPATLDFDEGLFFHLAYLENKLHELIDGLPMEEWPFHGALSTIRDFTGEPFGNKYTGIYDIIEMEIKTPPEEWPDYSVAGYPPKYPPQYPAYTNILIGQYDLSRYIEWSEDSTRPDEVWYIPFRVLEYLTAERARGEPGCLLADEPDIRPCDMTWAWEPSGRDMLKRIYTQNPDRIWPKYRPG